MTKISPAEGSTPTTDIRGSTLEKAVLRWDDSSKDAGASSIFSKQGVWVGKPSWYVMWLLGLWWFFDFTYCIVSNPDVGMFGQWGLCSSPLMIPASFISGVGTLGASTALMIKYRGYAKPLVFIVVLGGVLNFVNAIIVLATNYCSTDKGYKNSTVFEMADRPCGLEMALTPMAYGLCQIINSLLLLITPQHSFWIVTAGLFLYNICLVTAHIVKDDMQQAIQTLGTSFGFICVGVGLKYMFEQSKAKAIALTLKDYQKYRTVWEETLKNHKIDLQYLEQVWNENINTLPKASKRQPGNSSRIGKPIYFPGKKWVIKQDPKISELFATADVVNPLLQKKCMAWSSTLPCCESKHKEHVSKFHPGKVKTTSRAMVKLFRSYDEDVGKLCDLCRCSLVFATVKDLADGLLMICKDNDVEIQSCNPLKQRFAIEYDDKISAGYRDVQLSVKIKTDENQKNGLAAEHHLCEVQLHLKSFYEKKGEGGHDNYKIARNLRGA